MKTEIWKGVVGLSSRYVVSNLGRVASILRYDINAKKYIQCFKIKSHALHGTGCFVVNLHSGLNKYKTMRVHRLVADAFLYNPENKKTVNHKNGNRLDNTLDNLEWATQSENNIHSYEVLKKAPSFLGKSGNLHHRSKPVAQLNRNGDIIRTFQSANLATKELGINGVAKSATKGCKAGGFHWKWI